MGILKKIFYTTISIFAFVILFANISKADTVRVTTETLNLREEPSTDSDIIALISIGEECKVISDEGDWYKVEYGDYTGYISKEYAEPVDTEENNQDETDNNTTTENSNSNNTNANSNGEENNNSNTNSTNGAENTLTTSNEEDNQITDNSTTSLIGKITQKTNIKIIPLIYSSNLENINADEEVTVIEQINNWVYVQTDEVSGWVRSDCILIENNNTNSSDNKSNSGDSNSNDNTIDNTDDSNTDNDKNQNTDNNSDNDTDTSRFEKKTMYTQDYVNIRKGPSTSSDIIMVVSENTALEVIGEEGDWYKVNTSEGEAYVTKSALADERVQVTNRGSVDRSNSNDKTTTSTTNTSKTSDSDSGVTGNEIVAYAKKFLGVPYVYGGASSSGFDCSGFTMYVFNHFGISMGHGAQMQSRLGEEVEANKNSKTSLLENLEVGDLVFFLDYETMDEIGHCGIYIGDGNFIHASSGSGYCVKINSLLPGEYYNTRYCTARRVL